MLIGYILYCIFHIHVFHYAYLGTDTFQDDLTIAMPLEITLSQNHGIAGVERDLRGMSESNIPAKTGS